MKPWMLVASVVWVVVGVLGAGCRETRAEEPKAMDMGQGLVVVELFTSEGCSSCPSADVVLRELGSEASLAGKVLPLSFHVDYWDYLGWKDPFSSPRWSSRQREYGRAWSSKRIYTPQMVIQGQSHVVGSQRGEVRRKIEAASQSALPGKASAVASWDKGKVKVEVSAALPKAAASKKSQVWVVLFESGMSRAVTRGENTGRTLKHDFVVRRMEEVFSLSPGQEEKKSLSLEVDPSWKKEAVGVAVLVQDRETMQLYAAARAPLAAP